MKDKILIVDDEWNMRNLLKIHLAPILIMMRPRMERSSKKINDGNFQLIILLNNHPRQY